MTEVHGATVAEIIDEAPIGRLQVMVFAFCALVSLLDGFDTQAIAFVAPAISREWNLSHFDFGFIFSATLLGSVFGSSLFGVLADRFGRKWLIIVTTIIFGVFTGACAFATNFQELLILRVLGGLGLGGAIPNMLAMASEYAPHRKRATVVTATLWGFGGGGILGGLVSGPVLTAFGWKAVFIIGGIAPLLLVLVLIPCLPESLRFLACNPAKRETVITILARIAPGRTQNLILRPEQSAPRSSGGRISALFTPGLAATTLLLAGTMFLSLFLTYLMLNWVPSLLEAAGMSLSNAILGTVAINFGGIVGSFFISRAIDGHARPLRLLAAGYLASGVTIAVAGHVSGSVPAVLGILTVCGFLLIGTQLSTTAFTVDQFPVALRGTGVGFVQAVGRTGSLIGPLLGGMLLSAGLSSEDLFNLAFIPAALAALALFLLAAIHHRPATRGPLDSQEGLAQCPHP